MEDKDMQKFVESLAQTSVDSVADGQSQNTYIMEALNILKKTVIKGDNAMQVAQIYSTLALVDQLVLINRGISALAQIQSVQAQLSSRIVPASAVPSNLIT